MGKFVDEIFLKTITFVKVHIFYVNVILRKVCDDF